MKHLFIKIHRKLKLWTCLCLAASEDRVVARTMTSKWSIRHYPQFRFSIDSCLFCENRLAILKNIWFLSKSHHSKAVPRTVIETIADTCTNKETLSFFRGSRQSA